MPLCAPAWRFVEAERDVPLVEGPLEIAPVAEDARQEVVRVGQLGIPGQAGDRDLLGRIELPAAPQRLAERQEDQARRIGRQLRRSGRGCLHCSRRPPSASFRVSTAARQRRTTSSRPRSLSARVAAPPSAPTPRAPLRNGPAPTSARPSNRRAGAHAGSQRSAWVEPEDRLVVARFRDQHPPEHEMGRGLVRKREHRLLGREAGPRHLAQQQPLLRRRTPGPRGRAPAPRPGRERPVPPVAIIPAVASPKSVRATSKSERPSARGERAEIGGAVDAGQHLPLERQEVEQPAVVIQANWSIAGRRRDAAPWPRSGTTRRSGAPPPSGAIRSGCGRSPRRAPTGSGPSSNEK